MRKLLTFLILSISISTCLRLQASTRLDECKILYDQAKYQLAIPACTDAAKGGDNTAQTWLGEIYDQAGNHQKSAYWWGRAAKSGYQPARNLLALKYYYGGTIFGPEKGWKQDYSKAFDIWMVDAKEGVASSQFMIGVMYQNGFGVKKNLAESYYWLKVSLSNGYKLSTDVLIGISREITAEQRKIGEKKLEKYRKTKKKN